MGASAAAAAIAVAQGASAHNQSQKATAQTNERTRKAGAAKAKSDKIKAALTAQSSTDAGSRIAAEKQVLARRGKGSVAKSKNTGYLG